MATGKDNAVTANTLANHGAQAVSGFLDTMINGFVGFLKGIPILGLLIDYMGIGDQIKNSSAVGDLKGRASNAVAETLKENDLTARAAEKLNEVQEMATKALDNVMPTAQVKANDVKPSTPVSGGDSPSAPDAPSATLPKPKDTKAATVNK